ncbi:ribonuclease toxin immunity protein CdiI [Listeria seeligeri]|uniref:ribonuclease toxin immunity protein CdiI n=1 Tax=Listeria seeligeri TaxID=1640 RepID=UPI001E2EE9E5|nr:ribonuclease toxin immunity protein CdiI [Listeria seeligeri]
MKEIIKENQLISESHFPVKIIFNEIENERFLDVIKVVCNGEGFGVEAGACLFPNDLDACDIAQGNGFVGVEFGLYSGEEIVITYKEFYFYLEIICESYLIDFPEEKEFVKEKLRNYRKLYSIK